MFHDVEFGHRAV